jgi:hypothetical protein
VVRAPLVLGPLRVDCAVAAKVTLPPFGADPGFSRRDHPTAALGRDPTFSLTHYL